MMVIVMKKQKEKICVIKQRLKSNDDKKYLLNNEIIFKSQKRFKTEAHKVFTEEINKVTLSSNNDTRLQTFDGITSYPYSTSFSK